MNSYDEWRRKQRAKIGESVDVTHFRVAQQAAVASAHLTEDPNWDKFLTYLQAAIEGGEYAEQGWLNALTAANTTPQGMTEAKIKLHEVRGMVNALKWVLAIPKSLRDLGVTATDLEFSTTEGR